MRALSATGIHLKEIMSTSREAQELSNHLQVLEALLQSIKTALKASKGPEEFREIWDKFARKIFQAIRSTFETINSKIVARRRSMLSILSRSKWALSRQETMTLQAQLRSYIQVLSIAEDSFKQ